MVMVKMLRSQAAAHYGR